MKDSHTGNKTIDWVALRRRLDEAHAGLDSASEVNHEATQRVLKQRAALLAEPAVRETESGSVDLITFRLGRESCAIDTKVVLNVFRLAGLARLPGAAVPVYGVTLWRGEIMTVLDLRPLLGLSTIALSDLGRVIVVGQSRAAFGFLADSVTGVRATLPTEIHPSSGKSGLHQGLVRGITSDAVLVLDAEELLRLGNSGA
jgi:purine-binding chemotaxis protein CheW